LHKRESLDRGERRERSTEKGDAFLKGASGQPAEEKSDRLKVSQIGNTS